MNDAIHDGDVFIILFEYDDPLVNNFEDIRKKEIK